MTVGKYLTAKHRAVPSFSVKRSVECTDLVCRTHPFGLLASCERSGTRIGASSPIWHRAGGRGVSIQQRHRHVGRKLSRG